MPRTRSVSRVDDSAQFLSAHLDDLDHARSFQPVSQVRANFVAPGAMQTMLSF